MGTSQNIMDIETEKGTHKVYETDRWNLTCWKKPNAKLMITVGIQNSFQNRWELMHG